MINTIRNWWQNNYASIVHDIRRFDRFMIRLSRNCWRLIFTGIILNVIANFYPEFPERFPVIYGWFDGWLQLGEFALKAIFSGLYAIFTGNFFEYLTEFSEEFGQLCQQFIHWLSMIHF